MVYLKLFESFEEVVKQVDYNEYYNFINGRERESFTDYEKKLINSTSPVEIEFKGHIDIKYREFNSNKIILTRLLLHKFEDSWYTIRNISVAGKHDYYICDEFESMITTLKKIKRSI